MVHYFTKCLFFSANKNRNDIIEQLEEEEKKAGVPGKVEDTSSPLVPKLNHPRIQTIEVKFLSKTTHMRSCSLRLLMGANEGWRRDPALFVLLCGFMNVGQDERKTILKASSRGVQSHKWIYSQNSFNLKCYFL